MYSILKGVSEALGYMSMMADWGRRLSCEAKADASAALGIIERKGLGKLRHIDTTYLWLQQAECKRRVNFAKVPGTTNCADLGTKPLNFENILKHMEALSAYFADGRAEYTP